VHDHTFGTIIVRIVSWKIITGRSPTLSSLEFALLGLLERKPQSGYDLRKVFAKTALGHFSDSPGSIYPALGRLEMRKWITAAEEKNSARKRRLLRLTPAGNRALIRWLLEPVTREDVVRGIDRLLLRFAFFDGNLSRPRACRFLDDLERELEAYVGELEHFASTSGLFDRLTTGGLSFSNGLEAYCTHLSWTRRARKKLSEGA
jgi:DNA-binding PadR family transcriptional regulator